MTIALKPALLSITLSILISGCVTAGPVVERRVDMSAPVHDVTQGAASGAETTAQDASQRTVTFALHPAYRSNPPGCAVISAAEQQHARSVLAGEVERALTAHLSLKMNRVISGRMRDRIVRRQAVDLNHPADRSAFARAQNCRSFLVWRFTEASETYLLAWSSRRIGLELELTGLSKADLLWRARHTVSRSGGGLPLSPVGLVIDSVNAGGFINDADITPSMIHDVVRRLLLTLPPSM